MPPEPQNSPKLSPPVFIWILILVAALIGSLQIWQASLQKVVEVSKPLETITSADQFAGWKTYRNKEYGFEISYLKNIENATSTYFEKDKYFLLTIRGNKIGQSNQILVYVFNNPQNLSLKKWWQNEKITNSFLCEESTEIEFYGQMSLKSCEGDEGVVDDVYYIKNGNYIYKISIEISDTKIMSTFKFISTSTSTGVLSYKSGIRGMVTIGPTCPVMREPPDPQCADKPYQASLRIKNQAGKVVIEVKTNKDGTFKFDLPPGQYTIENAAGGVMPSLSPVTVTVGQNGYQEVNLQFDSGIR